MGEDEQPVYQCPKCRQGSHKLCGKTFCDCPHLTKPAGEDDGRDDMPSSTPNLDAARLLGGKAQV